MTLDDLIEIANKAYSDDLVLQYHEQPDGQHGDGLARFIAIELGETFDPGATAVEQLEEAAWVIKIACDDIFQVWNALVAARYKEG